MDEEGQARKRLEKIANRLNIVMGISIPLMMGIGGTISYFTKVPEYFVYSCGIGMVISLGVTPERNRLYEEIDRFEQ